MIPAYRENGIRAALLEASFFFNQRLPEDQLLAMMKRFHVVHLTTTEEGVTRFDEAHKKRRRRRGTRAGALRRGGRRTVSSAPAGPLSRRRGRTVLERRARAAGREDPP